MIAPLVSTREMDSRSRSETLFAVTGLVFPVCSHEKALNQSLISGIDATLRNFISQNILSIRKLQGSGHISPKSADHIMDFVEVSKKLVSQFSETFIGLQQQNAIVAKPLFPPTLLWHHICTSGRQPDVEIEQLRLRQMEEAFEKLFILKTDGENIYLCGDSQSAVSFA